MLSKSRGLQILLTDKYSLSAFLFKHTGRACTRRRSAAAREKQASREDCTGRFCPPRCPQLISTHSAFCRSFAFPLSYRHRSQQSLSAAAVVDELWRAAKASWLLRGGIRIKNCWLRQRGPCFCCTCIRGRAPLHLGWFLFFVYLTKVKGLGCIALKMDFMFISDVLFSFSTLS